MHNLYHLSDGLIYQKKIKLGTLSLILIAVLIIALLIPLTLLYPNGWVMVIDIFLTSSYLSYAYIFVFFVKKQYKNAYQFLAKIQHFPHQETVGMVVRIDHFCITRFAQQVHQVQLDNGRTVFLEHCFADLIDINHTYNFILLENMVIGYSEWLNHE